MGHAFLFVPRGAYVVAVSETSDPDSVGVGVGTPTAIEVGDSATGEIDYAATRDAFGGDRDWYKMTLAEGAAPENR